MKTLEIEVPFRILGNMAYSRHSELLEGDLGNNVATMEAIKEVKLLIAFEEAIATKVDFLQIRIRYDEAEGT